MDENNLFTALKKMKPLNGKKKKKLLVQHGEGGREGRCICTVH